MPHISLTRPSPNTWLLTLSSPPNNLLSASALQDLSEALNVVEYEWLARSPTSSASSTQLKKEDNAKKANIKGAGAGALVLTGEGRSFSAGIDHLALFQLAKQGGDPDSFFPKVFDPVLWRLMTFPLYTVAAINGHAIAAGMILALACDHRIMTSGKGFLSMNEITLGTTLPSSFVSVLSTAFPSRRDLRDTVAGKRWVQNDLLKLGLVDEVSAPGELLKRSVEIGQQEGVKVALGNWGRIKSAIHSRTYPQSPARPPVSPQDSAIIRRPAQPGEAPTGGDESQTEDEKRRKALMDMEGVDKLETGRWREAVGIGLMEVEVWLKSA